ncbi:uncharacterized protein LOC107201554 [Parus major]|uniref:uncharacterized protein LOC107201554 n=1 Tax=Parus major TaxID=9157 RepID=UPI00077134D0|nr:uncharacterized protein LOC107201554 [Parus major]
MTRPSPPHLQGLPGTPTPGSPASFSCHPRHPALPPAASLRGRNSSAAGRNHLWDRSPAPQLLPSHSCGSTGSAGWGGPSTGHLLRLRLRAEITFSAPLLGVPSRVGALGERGSRRVLTGLSAWKASAPLGKSRPAPAPCLGAPREGTAVPAVGEHRGRPFPAASCGALFRNILPPNTSPRSRFRPTGSGCVSPPLKLQGPCLALQPSEGLEVCQEARTICLCCSREQPVFVKCKRKSWTERRRKKHAIPLSITDL